MSDCKPGSDSDGSLRNSGKTDIQSIMGSTESYTWITALTFLIMYCVAVTNVHACRQLDLDKVRSDNKYLKEKHCLVAHVDLIQACHNDDWEKVVTQADILISKKALDRDSMFCFAKALKNLGRGHEALNTYLKAGSAETLCKLEYWGTCSPDQKALKAEIGSAISTELGFPLSSEVWKASDHYELASYLEAAGKYEESKVANERGDKVIDSYCPPDKAICQRLKVYMKDRIH